MNNVADFSGCEIIQEAMEIEKRGHAFYSAMAEWAEDERVREIYRWLAEDEITHLKTLEKLLPHFEEGEGWQNKAEILPYLDRFGDDKIFPSVEQLRDLVGDFHADRKSLDLAIKAEEQFSELFRLAASQARLESAREAFNWLKEEEDRHADKLRQRRQSLFG